jgi:hypothetical protein
VGLQFIIGKRRFCGNVFFPIHNQAGALGRKRATMAPPAIPDVITVVSSAYFQPIADLVDNLLSRPVSIVASGQVLSFALDYHLRGTIQDLIII